jgi:hypothetical protein
MLDVELLRLDQALPVSLEGHGSSPTMQDGAAGSAAPSI